ncbi:MAG: PKD-like domain-containing protein [Cytophagales bacterium]|nr:PKD-like domain-containing protein [Cytophagales bacterium]
MDFRPDGFLENKGQWDADELQFFLDKGGLQVALGLDRFTYILNYRESTSGGNQYFQHNIQVQLVGANPSPRVSKTGKSADYRNYFFGKTQASKIHHYEQVTYHDVYPGIDVVFETAAPDTRRMGFKYSFIVHPGANPDQIRLNYDGQDELGINHSSGIHTSHESDEENLVSNLLTLTTQGGVVAEDLKEVYTISSGIRQSVPAKFQLDSEKEVHFDLGEYDQSKTLVIDPEVVTLTLRVSTYLGGEEEDLIYGVDISNDGNTVYVTGASNSSDLLTNALSLGFQPGKSGGNDAFIGSFDATLENLLWATYMGGGTESSNIDVGFDIKLDESSSNLFISGRTGSDSVASPFFGAYAGEADGFVTSVSTDGQTLNWLRFVGSDRNDYMSALDIDDDAVIVVGTVGNSLSTDNIDGATVENAYADGNDAIILKLSATSGTLERISYAGSSLEDRGHDIVAHNNEYYIIGSRTVDLGGIELVRIGLTKLDQDLDIILEKTPFGQTTHPNDNIPNQGIDISTDGSFLAITGVISSSSSDIVVGNTHQNTNGGNGDAYLLRVDAGTLDLDWGSYYGGSGSDEGTDIIIDCNDNIIFTGTTNSENNIATSDALEGNESFGGASVGDSNGDVFLAKFDSEGNRIWGTYFGAGGSDRGISLGINEANGEFVLGGVTRSSTRIATTGVSQSSLNDANEGFVSAFCDVIIIQSPQDELSAVFGGDATFEIETDYCGTISYSWTKQGESTVLSTSSVLTLTSLTEADIGTYCVTVNTSCGADFERCAELDVLSLAGSDVCLDPGTTSGAPAITQDTIALTFPNLEDNANITNALYSWSVTSSDADPNDASTVVAGPSGAISRTLPITNEADLYEIDIIPTAAGTYTYTLDLSYDVDGTPTTESLEVEVTVNPFPTITASDPASFCESGSTTIEVTSDIDLDRVEYQRIDSNTGLTGNSSGTQSGAGLSVSINLGSFENATNMPLDAVFELTPYASTGNCVGATETVTVTVNPEPEFSTTVVTDTICSSGNVEINFEALTSPNFQTGSGTSFEYTRRANTAIDEPTATVTVTDPNSGTINESLTNNSSQIATVTYDITGTFEGCSADTSVSLLVLPVLTLEHSGTTVNGCSGEDVSLSLGVSNDQIATFLEVTFDDNPNVDGESDTTISVSAGSSVTLVANLTHSSSSTETVTANITPVYTLASGDRCEGTQESFDFEIAPLATVSDSNAAICENTSPNIDLTSLSNGITGTTFSWTAVSATGNVTFNATGSGDTIDETLSLTSGTEGTVTYTVTGSFEGCSGATGEIVVTVYSQPELLISADPTSAELCDSSPMPVELTVTVSNTDEANITSRTWFKDGLEITGENTNTLTVEEAGLYEFRVQTLGDCSQSISQDVAIVERANVEIDASSENEVCLEEDFVLTSVVTGGVASSYQWFRDGTAISGATGTTYTTGIEGAYQVVVNSAGACPDTSNVVNLTFFAEPVPTFNLDESTCPNITLDFTGSNTNASANVTRVEWSVTGEAPLPTFSTTSELATSLSFGENQGTDRNYTVSLSLTTDNDCEATFSRDITHLARPLVDFEFETLNCSGEISLATQNTTGGDTFQWAITSGGSDLTITDPTNLNTTFEVENETREIVTYDITLTATDDTDCSHEATQTLSVYPTPIMVIDNAPRGVCPGDPISLTSENSDPGTGLSFDEVSWFINGTLVSNATTLDTTLTNTGEEEIDYVIELRGTNEGQCEGIVDTKTIQVAPDPQAVVTTNFTAACDGIAVNINNESVGLPEFYVIDYGDGSPVDTLFNQEPIPHIFQNNTFDDVTYTVELSAISACGVSTDSVNVTVIPVNEDAEIDLGRPSNDYCEGDLLNAGVNGLTDGTGRDFEWTLVAENSTDSLQLSLTDTVQNHELDQAGTFHLILSVEIATGGVVCGRVQDVETIIVEPGPDISFEVEPSSICLGETVEVINTSSILSEETIWDLGDGTDLEPTETPGTHQYNNPGMYWVNMTLEGTNGCFSYDSSQVEVKSVPTAAIESPGRICENDRITFINNSVGADSYQWEISRLTDSLSNSVNVTRSFFEPGSYYINLTAFGPGPDPICFDKDSLAFEVNANPEVSFRLDDERYCEDSTVTVINDPSEATYEWTLINSNTDEVILLSDQNTPDPFDAPSVGNYYVKSMAVSSAGCSLEDSLPLRAIANPIPIVFPTQTAICHGIEFDLFNQTDVPSEETGIFQWYMDGNLISEEYRVSPVFSRVARSIGRDSQVTFRLDVTNEICENNWQMTYDVPGYYGCSFTLPNAFSPNGDGTNDQFLVQFHDEDLDNVERVELSIFGTTENLVHHLVMSRDAVGEEMSCDGCTGEFIAEEWQKSVGWDGKITTPGNNRSEDNNRGTYFYVVKVQCCDDKPIARTGYFQLIR